ncbi:transaldolase [Verticillium dahliae]
MASDTSANFWYKPQSVAASKKPEYTSLVDEVVNYAKGKGGNDNHEVNAVLNSLALSS